MLYRGDAPEGVTGVSVIILIGTPPHTDWRQRRIYIAARSFISLGFCRFFCILYYIFYKIMILQSYL